ncbi:class I SAM-dependent methyltransferase [Actinomadura kijaniata]|uniref:class I SAM-dependent methyltransferase n=1 Tax=Actinomadura kijaniata TaxID=46161 RepID=UPI003F1C817C
MSTENPSRPSEEEVRAGAAGYGRAVLASYDLFVLGLVCRMVWRCPRGRMLELYDRNVGARHLDLGPGSGFFLDRCSYPVADPRLTLLDLNEDVLAKTGRRLARFSPVLLSRDVLEPLELGEARFDSAGLNFLLHCLPGGLAHKSSVFDHAAEYVRAGGRIFGSTVLALGVEHGRLAPRALESLNEDRTMSNAEDSLEELDAEMARRFADYRITVRGSVALFEATV